MARSRSGSQHAMDGSRVVAASLKVYIEAELVIGSGEDGFGKAGNSGRKRICIRIYL